MYFLFLCMTTSYVLYKNGTYALCWKKRTNHILCNIAWGYIENLRDNRIIYNLFLTIDLFRFWTYHFIIILEALPLEAFTLYFSFFLNKKKIVMVFFPLAISIWRMFAPSPKIWKASLNRRTISVWWFARS